jgi:hypothetical protein
MPLIIIATIVAYVLAAWVNPPAPAPDHAG